MKKPFYKNSAWIRCVIIGEVVVFGSLIIFWILSVFISAIMGPWFISDIYRHFVFFQYLCNVVIVFVLAPMLLWQLVGETFYPREPEAMMMFTIPVFITFVLWWIFLGVVLGSVIYRVRMYLQRKKNNHIDP